MRPKLYDQTITPSMLFLPAPTAKADQHKEQVSELKRQLTSAMDLPEGYWDRRWQFTDIHDALTSLKAHGKAVPKGVSHEMEVEVNKLVRPWGAGAYV